MHIFCKYGKWTDIAAVASGGLLIQEKRCSVCNKVKRRQTMFLGGEYDQPIPSAGHKPKGGEPQPPSNDKSNQTVGIADKIRDAHIKSRNYAIEQAACIVYNDVENATLRDSLTAKIRGLRLEYQS